MKQEVFSWSDKFTIKDEQGNDRYSAEGQLISLGHKLHIYDVNGSNVAYVKQKLLAFTPRYEVYINDSLAVTIKKEITLINPKYTIDCVLADSSKSSRKDTDTYTHDR